MSLVHAEVAMIASGRVVDASSGEVVALADLDDASVADAAERLDRLMDDVREARGVLRDELARRLKREKSMSAGACFVERKITNRWDVDGTWAALAMLVEDGHIGPDEADEAMPEKAVRKPDGRKLNSLLTRLVGEDPVAAGPLAQARVSVESIGVKRVAQDSTAIEEAS